MDVLTDMAAGFVANLDKLPHVSVAAASAVACGALIGWERESKGKAAGLRTNTLICLGAAMYMMIGTFISLPGVPGSDPARMGAQVVSGIGFLGAGTIMRGRASIHGLTTAATIWVVAAIGCFCGAGYPIEALLFTVVLFGILTGLGRLEQATVGACDYKLVEVVVGAKKTRTQARVGGLFEQHLRRSGGLMWVHDGDHMVLRASVCQRHLFHRAFLADVWRVPGVEMVRYTDGTVPFIPISSDEDELAEIGLLTTGSKRRVGAPKKPSGT